MKLKLDYDLADKITLTNLVDMYRSCTREIKSVNRIPEPVPGYRLEDKANAKRIRKNIKQVIKYITTSSEYKELNL